MQQSRQLPSPLYSMDIVPDKDFCLALPKVELHAHLTGSITKPILQKIWDTRSTEPDFEVESPETALCEGTGQDIGVFFAHFNTYLYSLISDLPSLILATRSVLEAFQADGVIYLELRTTPRSIGTHDAEAAIRAVLSVIEDWNQVEPMRVSLILSIDQAKHSPETALQIVNLASTLKTENHPVVGVDLCGDPNRAADPITFRPAFKLAKEKGLGIVLHFAEVPNTSSPEILSEMLSWQPNRLGHVIHVPPAIRRMIIERNIGVELCLTCNVLAGMLPTRGSFEEHHFPDWWSGSDAPKVSLGTDDVGVFGSMSSEEHLLAARHFGLSRQDLVKLTRCALSTALGITDSARQVIDNFE